MQARFRRGKKSHCLKSSASFRSLGVRLENPHIDSWHAIRAKTWREAENANCFIYKFEMIENLRDISAWDSRAEWNEIENGLASCGTCI